jgi:hypothetical protein
VLVTIKPPRVRIGRRVCESESGLSKTPPPRPRDGSSETHVKAG